MRDTSSQALNRRGEWVPSIPEPFFGLRMHCDCGAKFWSRDAYEGHYALVHILGMSDKKSRKIRQDNEAIARMYG